MKGRLEVYKELRKVTGCGERIVKHHQELYTPPVSTDAVYTDRWADVEAKTGPHLVEK